MLNGTPKLLAISAQQNIILRKQEDWNDMNEAWLDDPEQAATHMVMGMSSKPKKTRQDKETSKSQSTNWV